MPRYIDADELLKKSFRIEGHIDLPSGKAQNFSAINDTEIINFPTADVVPVVHGEWKESNIPCEDYVCSVCGGANWYYGTNGMITLSKYCPNCGAKMDGDKNEM